MVLLEPDGRNREPAHLATAVGTPVIGLYAATNPDRARPYLSAEYVINRYPEAVMAKYNTTVDCIPWGTRVRDRSTMDLIRVKDITDRLDVLYRRSSRNTV